MINKIVLLLMFSSLLTSCADPLPEWTELDNRRFRELVANDYICSTIASSLVSENPSYQADIKYYDARALSMMAYKSCDVDIQVALNLGCNGGYRQARKQGSKAKLSLVNDCPKVTINKERRKSCANKVEAYRDKYVTPLVRSKASELDRQKSFVSEKVSADFNKTKYSELCGYEG